MKKVFTIALALTLPLQSFAGSYFDHYAYTSFDQALKYVKVEKVQPGLVKVSTLCRESAAAESQECEAPLLFSEDSLQILAIRESLDTMTTFGMGTATVQQKEKQKASTQEKLVKTLAIATFLIPGLGPFVNVGVGVAYGYMGLWTITMIGTFQKNSNPGNEQLNQDIKAGYAGIILKALKNEGVEVSSYDRADVLTKIRAGLTNLYQDQIQRENHSLKKLRLQTGDVQNEDLAKLIDTISAWKSMYEIKLTELNIRKSEISTFEYLITEKLHQTQIDLLNTSLQKAQSSPSFEEYLRLKMLVEGAKN